MSEAMKAICNLCGEPMPEGEEMFKFHGYSGPCPKPYLKRAAPPSDPRLALFNDAVAALCGIPDMPDVIRPASWLKSAIDALSTKEVRALVDGDDPSATDDMLTELTRLQFALQNLWVRIDALEKGEGK